MEGEKRGRGEDGGREFVLLPLDWQTGCVYSPQNTHNIAQAFKKNNRGRLPERHEYLSMLAAFTTKSYNTGA